MTAAPPDSGSAARAWLHRFVRESHAAGTERRRREQPFVSHNQEDTEKPATRTPWGGTVGRLLIVLFVALLMLVRRPDSFFNPQLWAEDGSVFLAGQRVFGAQALLQPYAGYSHLLLRIVALAWSGVPLEWIPLFYNLSALAFQLFAAWFVLVCRAELPQRWLLASLFALVPNPGEVLLTLTNVQWLLAPVLALLLIQPSPRSRAVAGAEIALLSLLGLTGPFVLLFWPLLIYRWRVQGWDRYGTALTAIVCVTGAVQAYLFVTANLGPVPSASPVFGDWLQAVSYQLPGGVFLGRLLPRVPYSKRTMLVAALLLAAFFAAVLRLPLAKRRLAAVFLFCGTISYAAAMYRLRAEPMSISNLGNGNRYFYLPYLFTCWTTVVLLSERGMPRAVGAACGALIAVSSATFFRIPPHADLNWRQEIREYRETGDRDVKINPNWIIDIDVVGNRVIPP